MSFRHSGVVDSPVDVVFAWHTRPGAIVRLTPPWQPVRVNAEAGSLREGRAVLGLPGGLRWIAAHQPDGYEPPNQFVDQLTARPLSMLLSWRHTHQFTPVDAGTLVTDTVETSLPSARLRAMFTYRHTQLADDLASHARSRAWRSEPVTVAVTGSSGVVGTAVCALLSTGGHRVIRLVRRPARGPDERRWDPEEPGRDLLSGVDAVVHLAGASIAGRFTSAHRAAIRDSRILPTRKLARLAATTPDGPGVFVSASAIGYYGFDRGDEILTESSPRGDGFLADVVGDWEAATEPAAEAGLRTVRVRTGIVQTPLGGTLRLFSPLFSAGLGGQLDGGHQWTSWIGLDDVADIYLRAVLDPALSGPVNATTAHPMRNRDYTRTLARVLRRPALFPVPAAALRLTLGEHGARELPLASQRVQPAVLQQARHHFRYSILDTALRHLLGRNVRDSSG